MQKSHQESVLSAQASLSELNNYRYQGYMVTKRHFQFQSEELQKMTLAGATPAITYQR